jgi:hypothetical protein
MTSFIKREILLSLNPLVYRFLARKRPVSVSAAIELLVKAGFQITDGNTHLDKKVLGT